MFNINNEEELILHLIKGLKEHAGPPGLISILQNKIESFVNLLLNQKKYFNVINICERAEEAMLANAAIYFANSLAYIGLIDANLANKIYVSAIAGCDIAISYVRKAKQFSPEVSALEGLILSKRGYAYACVGKYKQADEDTHAAVIIYPSSQTVFITRLVEAKTIYETSVAEFIVQEPKTNYLSDIDIIKLRRKNLFNYHIDCITCIIEEAEPDRFEFYRFTFLLAELYAKCNYTYACNKEKITIQNITFGKEPIEVEQDRIKIAAQYYIDALDTALKKLCAVSTNSSGLSVQVINVSEGDQAKSSQTGSVQVLKGYLLNCNSGAEPTGVLDTILSAILMPLFIQSIIGISQLCTNSLLGRTVLAQALSAEYQATLKQCLIDSKSIVIQDSSVEGIDALKQHYMQYPDTNIYAVFNIPILSKNAQLRKGPQKSNQ